jgi:vacuolar protein sorting-associated protein 29
MNPELVLVVGDLFIPQRTPDISDQFKTVLTPNKVQHVLCLGNVGNQETYDWLKGLSKDFHIIKGDFDQDDEDEKKVIQIGDFNIGIIHGHQVLPWGDLEALGIAQRQLGCDILISGHTHKTQVEVKDNVLFLNPGSFSGAFSPTIEDTIPSFILMVLTGDEAIIYLYTLNDKNKKFEVNKYDYKKGADNLFQIDNEEDEDDKKDEDEEEHEQDHEEEQEREEEHEEEHEKEQEPPQEPSQEPPQEQPKEQPQEQESNEIKEDAE